MSCCVTLKLVKIRFPLTRSEGTAAHRVVDIVVSCRLGFHEFTPDKVLDGRPVRRYTFPLARAELGVRIKWINRGVAPSSGAVGYFLRSERHLAV